MGPKRRDVLRWTASVRRMVGAGLLAAFLTAAGGYLPASAQGQNTLIQQQASGDIDFFVDVASFKNLQDPSQSYVEIYYTMDRSQMQFIELPNTPGVLSAAWEIETVIETEVGDRVTWNRWQVVSQDTTRSGAEATRDTYDIYTPPLMKPGVYRFITTVTDLNSRVSGDTRVGVDERLVLIPDYSTRPLSISDIEFAVRLGKASGENKFTKSGLQVVPNPLKLYGVNVDIFSFYTEVYGLSPASSEAPPNEYTRRVTVEGLNVDHRRVVDETTRPVRSRNEIIALTGINARTFPRGDYRLIVEVVDHASGERALREKAFRVLSEVTPAAEGGLSGIEMTEENVQRLRNEIEYLATPQQLAEYDSLDREGKREFLQAFWEERDPVPGTPENEFRQAWVQRFEYADENFTTPTQPAGWKTDQGRIWIKYGQPDDIIPHPDEGRGQVPWVEWIYNQMEDVGQARFIFADTSGGFGSYRLIHSNVPGETQNPNWREDLGIPPAGSPR
ncbi:MAG: GWxTD domain-containing protein [bacterium]